MRCWKGGKDFARQAQAAQLYGEILTRNPQRSRHSPPAGGAVHRAVAIQGGAAEPGHPPQGPTTKDEAAICISCSAVARRRDEDFAAAEKSYRTAVENRRFPEGRGDPASGQPAPRAAQAGGGGRPDHRPDGERRPGERSGLPRTRAVSPPLRPPGRRRRFPQGAQEHRTGPRSIWSWRNWPRPDRTSTRHAGPCNRDSRWRPRTRSLHQAQANLALRTGSASGAVASLNKSLGVMPDNVGLRWMLANLLANKGRRPN